MEEQFYLATPLTGPYHGQPFRNPQPLPLDPDTADFRDYGDRCKLATLGVFHTDASWFRAKRHNEHAIRIWLEDCYRSWGLDRQREHALIAEQCGGGGIWGRSTGEYARRCHALDAEIEARALARWRRG